MKQLISLLISLLPLLSMAQEMKVKSMEIIPSDLTARTNPRTDLDGNLCALLKIYVKDKITEVQGNAVGEVVDKGVEKWVYLSDHSKTIILNFDEHFPLRINFEDHNYRTVSEGMTYVLKLVEENEPEPVSQEPVASTPSQPSEEEPVSAAVAPQPPTPDTAKILKEGEKAYKDHKYLRALEIFLTIDHDKKAQNYIGDLYYMGWGVARNDQEALKWYQKSAEQGDLDSQNQLGDIYRYAGNRAGFQLDQEENYEKSVYWYRKAAEQGDTYGQYMLAEMYEQGLGVEKDLLEACRWYRKAADLGDKDAKKKLKKLGY